MSTLESIKQAFRNLLANKTRSILTMLGIIIGTGAVIAILSVGAGAQDAIQAEISSVGSNLIYVMSGVSFADDSEEPDKIIPLTRQDAEAIADTTRTTYVAGVAPEVSRSGTITYDGESVSLSVTGTTSDYLYVRNYVVEYGAFITDSDEQSSSRVVVLGADTAESLFGDAESALGETVRINSIPFEVVGVLESKGGSALPMFSSDELAIVPLTTAQDRLFADTYNSRYGDVVDYISVSADEGMSDEAMEEIRLILREEHDVNYGEDDFTLTSQESIAGVFDQVTNMFTIFLGAVAAISLLVGGIGIMNIMLVSVTERTREIGIRKAVGARESDILWQFLIESIVLSLVGGLLGIGFGWLVSAIVNSLDVFPTAVTSSSVFLSVAFSAAVGLFFGIYPARRAAQMEPIEALRHE